MKQDPYLAYTLRFFGRWARLYDLFGLGVLPVYRKAARLACADGGRVLDLATGTGAVASRCVGRAGRLVGLDYTPAMLRQARAKLPPGSCRFLLGDGRHLPFDDSSFDVVVISFALHDMPQAVRLEVLGEAARVAPRLVVADYDADTASLWGKIGVGLLRQVESPYFPGFLKRGGEAILREAGRSPELRFRWLGLASVWEAKLP